MEADDVETDVVDEAIESEDDGAPVRGDALEGDADGAHRVDVGVVDRGEDGPGSCGMVRIEGGGGIVADKAVVLEGVDLGGEGLLGERTRGSDFTEVVLERSPLAGGHLDGAYDSGVAGAVDEVDSGGLGVLIGIGDRMGNADGRGEDTAYDEEWDDDMCSHMCFPHCRDASRVFEYFVNFF